MDAKSDLYYQQLYIWQNIGFIQSNTIKFFWRIFANYSIDYKERNFCHSIIYLPLFVKKKEYHITYTLLKLIICKN